MNKRFYPFINKFTGDLRSLPLAEGKKLSEDWARPRITKNDKGEKVFRFEIQAPVQDKHGVTHMGTAVVDISEVDNPAPLVAQNDDKSAK